MHVTPARPADLPAIQTLIRGLSAYHGDTATITLEALQDALFDSGLSCAFVARAGDAVIGYAGVNRTITLHTGAPRFDIHHLFVADGHRGKGIGKALIAAARAHAATEGAGGVTIGTDPKNLTAQAAYRQMGLEEITDAGPRFWVPVDQ